MRFSKRMMGFVLALIVLLGTSFSVPAFAARPSVEQNRAIALRFATEGWGTQPNWEETWDKWVSNDVVYHFNSGAEPIVGLAENKAFNASLFEGFPDIHQDIEDVLAENDKVVYRTTLQGTNTGTFLGLPPTGKSVKVNDFTMVRIANGKVAEMWYECNLLEVMQQLEVIPR
jgi:steroid delta-isomerase-like uncharacterized protein